VAELPVGVLCIAEAPKVEGGVPAPAPAPAPLPALLEGPVALPMVMVLVLLPRDHLSLPLRWGLEGDPAAPALPRELRVELDRRELILPGDAGSGGEEEEVVVAGPPRVADLLRAPMVLPLDLLVLGGGGTVVLGIVNFSGALALLGPALGGVWVLLLLPLLPPAGRATGVGLGLVLRLVDLLRVALGLRLMGCRHLHALSVTPPPPPPLPLPGPMEEDADCWAGEA
jgi:hypothetical protein